MRRLLSYLFMRWPLCSWRCRCSRRAGKLPTPSTGWRSRLDSPWRSRPRFAVAAGPSHGRLRAEATGANPARVRVSSLH